MSYFDALYEPAWIEQRRQRGEREPDRSVHYDLCDGVDCPCFQEGGDVRATNHYEMLLWFASVDPDLLRKALAEAHSEPEVAS